MIELRDVTYTYPNGVTAIRNLTLNIDSGVSILIGPNGSGKTTLLKIMACIYKPQSGTVLIDGKDYWKSNRREQLMIRRNIVYVHEKPILFRGTVIENIMFPLLIRGYERKEAEIRANEILRELGVENLGKRKRKELSAGELQLVAFARAIVVNPKYLLLDEPTNTLDIEKRKIVEKYIRKLSQRNKRIIIASHDRLLAAGLGDRIIILEHGRLKEITTSSKILDEIKAFTSQTSI